MKFSLDLEQPLDRAVRHIASGRLTAAAGLLREQPEGIARAVHGARRHIKQVRALYRLVASGDRDFQREGNRSLGATGRSLSGLRDATAWQEATGYLRREAPSKATGMLMDRLTRRLEQQRQGSVCDSTTVAQTLEAARLDLLSAADATRRLTLSASRRKNAVCLAAGWDSVSHKARRSMDKAISSAMPLAGGECREAFHDLRKRVQDRWMHAALMHDIWPTAFTAINRQAKSLSDLLGHLQDLALLLDEVTDSSDLVTDSVEREAIQDLIMSQQSRLHATCSNLAPILFANSRPGDGNQIEALLTLRWR